MYELTELWGFAQDEGVGPELADGSVVEALVTDGASEAAAAQDVKHVGAGSDRSDNTKNKRHRMKISIHSAFVSWIIHCIANPDFNATISTCVRTGK